MRYNLMCAALKCPVFRLKVKISNKKRQNNSLDFSYGNLYYVTVIDAGKGDIDDW